MGAGWDLCEGTSLTAGCAALSSPPSSRALTSSSPVARDPMWVSHLSTWCHVTTCVTHSLSIFWKSSSRGSWKVAASERCWSSSAREMSPHSSPSSPWPGGGVWPDHSPWPTLGHGARPPQLGHRLLLLAQAVVRPGLAQPDHVEVGHAQLVGVQLDAWKGSCSGAQLTRGLLTEQPVCVEEVQVEVMPVERVQGEATAGHGPWVAICGGGR